MTQWIMILLTVMAMLVLFFVTVMIIDGNHFHVVKYYLDSDKIKKEHRYAVLSDLHNKSYGKENEKT